jgi:hypothetical protein
LKTADHIAVEHGYSVMAQIHNLGSTSRHRAKMMINGLVSHVELHQEAGAAAAADQHSWVHEEGLV